MSASPTPLSARQVSLVRDGRTLLKGIDLTLHRGEVHLLLGPNGAGKSSLLRVLAGEWTASGGEIALQGQPLSRWSIPQQARLRAVLPQQDALAFGFTVRELVRLGRIAAARDASSHQQTLIDAVLRATDTLALAERLYPTLSGGERRRAQLARVLAQVWDAPSPVLLLDEPIHSLDLAHQHEVMTLLRAVAARGFTVLASLHDLNLAAAYGQRISLLRAGQLLATDVPARALTPSTLQKLYGESLDFTPHQLGAAPYWQVQRTSGG